MRNRQNTQKTIALTLTLTDNPKPYLLKLLHTDGSSFEHLHMMTTRAALMVVLLFLQHLDMITTRASTYGSPPLLTTFGYDDD